MSRRPLSGAAPGDRVAGAYVLNPLAYGVDLLKHELLGPGRPRGYGGEWSVALDVAALSGCALVGFITATLLISREGRVTHAVLRDSG